MEGTNHKGLAGHLTALAEEKGAKLKPENSPAYNSRHDRVIAEGECSDNVEQTDGNAEQSHSCPQPPSKRARFENRYSRPTHIGDVLKDLVEKVGRDAPLSRSALDRFTVTGDLAAQAVSACRRVLPREGELDEVGCASTSGLAPDAPRSPMPPANSLGAGRVVNQPPTPSPGPRCAQGECARVFIGPFPSGPR